MSNSEALESQQKRVPSAAAQQWVPAAMQYPASATMVMQHHHQMMPPPPPPPHYMAYHPQQVQQHFHSRAHYNIHASSSSSSSSSSADNKTLWVGDLHHWMDENYLHTCFAPTNEISSIKIIRNKQTGLSEGYGFVEFFSHATAEKVLQGYGGSFMLNTEQPYRLNWASFSTGEKRNSDSNNNNNNNNGGGGAASDLSIFVGDLAADVTDTTLLETFSVKYPSVKAAKVVFDANTGRSKGYGFVRFGDEAERSQAMNEMNGVYCSSRAMRIGAATPRKSSSGYQHGGYGSNGASTQGYQSETDSTNTTIFVGGLDPSVTDEDLRQPFAEFGEIVSVKIPSGKGCGFVQFANRDNAEEALQKLNGTVIGSQTVRLSWGRNPANKQYRGGDFSNQWGGGAYYGGQMYDGYGYAVPSPHEYAAAYGTYPVYGSHQQQVN